MKNFDQDFGLCLEIGFILKLGFPVKIKLLKVNAQSKKNVSGYT